MVQIEYSEGIKYFIEDTYKACVFSMNWGFTFPDGTRQELHVIQQFDERDYPGFEARLDKLLALVRAQSWTTIPKSIALLNPSSLVTTQTSTVES